MYQGGSKKFKSLIIRVAELVTSSAVDLYDRRLQFSKSCDSTHIRSRRPAVRVKTLHFGF